MASSFPWDIPRDSPNLSAAGVDHFVPGMSCAFVIQSVESPYARTELVSKWKS